MKRTAVIVAIVLAIIIAPAVARSEGAGRAVWTILVYLNGDNDLEEAMIDDFREMARVGSQTDLRVLVQFDRSSRRNYVPGKWTNTFRFEVPGPSAGWNEPIAERRIPVGGWSDTKEVDMGKGKSVVDFVRWGMKYRPASHYALILSGHGSGGRASASPTDASETNGRTMGPDEDDGSHRPNVKSLLYMRDLQDSLADLERRLDVIGFDACLMGTIEVHYAMRMAADVLITSEEKEPVSGWEFGDFLERVRNGVRVNPDRFGAEEFGKAAVASYDATGPSTKRTLAAIRTSAVPGLADRLSKLGSVAKDAVESRDGPAVNALKHARAQCHEYGDAFTVDIGCLATHLKNSPFEGAATDVLGAISAAVIAATRSPDRDLASGFGSMGSAVYLPMSSLHAEQDLLMRGAYALDGDAPVKYPVEFASSPALSWAPFVRQWVKTIMFLPPRELEFGQPDTD